MAKYITLIRWTAEGAKAVKQSPERLDRAREMAKGLGVTIETIYLVMGQRDMVAIIDAPDDAAMAKFALKQAASGAVSTETMKAFTEDEYRQLMAAL